MPKKNKKDYPKKNISVPVDVHARVKKYAKKKMLYDYEVVSNGIDRLENEDKGATMEEAAQLGQNSKTEVCK